MKLKEFNSQNSSFIKTGEPTISCNVKAGLMNLSAELCKSMKLEADDRVSVLQDEDTPQDWYLAASKEGFKLRKDRDDKSGNTALSFNNTITVKAIAKSLGIESNYFKCRVGDEPVILGKGKYFPIITKSVNIR